MPDLDDKWFDVIFVVVTALIAWHGISFRTKDGERDWIHALFGCIALFFCIWVLTHDLFEIF